MRAGNPHSQTISDRAENAGEEEAAEGEQQRNEKKKEIPMLLRGWQEMETSAVVRWAWADDIGEEHESQEDPEEESEDRRLEAQGCQAGGAEEP